MPPAGPAGNPRSPRPTRRPAVPGTADLTHRRGIADRPATRTAHGVVHRRGARAGLGVPPLAGEATWGIYQKIITAYREPDPRRGQELMQAVIDSLREGVPTVLVEARNLGRTLTRRADDVLAYFDRPRTSSGPTEAIKTAASNTSEVPPWGSATSPTTSPDPCWRPEDSEPTYTLDWDEPQKGFRRWASTRDISLRRRQPATGPPGSYPDRTPTGRRRRARQQITNHDDPLSLVARKIEDSGPS